MDEVWLDVVEYEGLYKVSNLGNVRSVSRIMYNHGKHPFKSKEKNLKPCMSTAGKLIVGLYKNKMQKMWQIHQLVAMSFLNHIPNGHVIVVDHINNIPTDNRLDNLQLITNRLNASKDRKGSSKYTGVSWIKKSKKWMSCIMINRKNINLGLYINEIDAHYAYQNKLKQIEDELG